MYGSFREESLELAVELGGQRLVMRDNERRPVQLLDDIGHGEGLAGASDAEQGLALEALIQAFDEFGDGLRLIAGGLEFGGEV